MQPAPTPRPSLIANPAVASLLVLGILLLVVGLAYYWPMSVLAAVLLVLALALPLAVGEPPVPPSPWAAAPAPSYPFPPAAVAAPATPPPPPAPPAPTCPRCGASLLFVDQYGRWFCPTENLYPWG